MPRRARPVPEPPSHAPGTPGAVRERLDRLHLEAALAAQLAFDPAEDALGPLREALRRLGVDANPAG